jgi:hypothetical protein
MQRPNMAKKYISFAVFCVIVLSVGVLLSLPFSLRVTSTGEKPPFLLAFLLLIASLFSFIMPLYLSYKAWVDGEETREKLGSRAEQLAQRYGPFRFLVVRNKTVLLWNARIAYPIVALFGLSLFILILLSAF